MMSNLLFKSSRLMVKVSLSWLILSLLVACGRAAAPPPSPTPLPLADELIFYNWTDYFPQSVLDDFTAEYGVPVKYVFFDSQEEAMDSLRAGGVYDVMVLENQFVPAMVDEGLLAEIDFRNVLNYNNVASNFRNLAYDPENLYTVPHTWGSTGLVVRTDLAQGPISSWSDLWNPAYAGRVAMRSGGTREPIGLALQYLGYSINSEDPAELEAALEVLLAWQQNGFVYIGSAVDELVAVLQEKEAVMVLGWGADVLVAREANPAIEYVLPTEGGMMWGDNFVIPASSPNKYTAELFINFALRPEQGAAIVQELYLPTANGAALELIDPALRDDPAVYPPDEALQNAEVLLPLSPAGEELHADIWGRFEAAQ